MKKLTDRKYFQNSKKNGATGDYGKKLDGHVALKII